MDKAALGVGVETSAEHADVILARSVEVFHGEHQSGLVLHFEETFRTTVLRSSLAMVR